MTDREIDLEKQRMAGARYRERIRSLTATETITWHPIPGPEMPDDEILVMLCFSSVGGDRDVMFGYHDWGEWNATVGMPFGETPIAWAYPPEGISDRKHKLMLHAQHLGRPGRPKKVKQPAV